MISSNQKKHVRDCLSNSIDKIWSDLHLNCHIRLPCLRPSLRLIYLTTRHLKCTHAHAHAHHE